MVWGESAIKELAAFLNQIKTFGEMKSIRREGILILGTIEI